MNAPGNNVNAYPKWVTEAVHIAPYDPTWPEKAARAVHLQLLPPGTKMTAKPIPTPKQPL